jgi:hypothetical protein
MAIKSYFYDSVNEDRKYSAEDFAKAFDIFLETGFLIRETQGGRFGFDIGGTNFTTIYEGKAVVEGRLVELTGTETLTVPSGSYSGQIVLNVDFVTAREATIVVKDVRAPIQTDTMYELPIYDVVVELGVIKSATDLRFQGGCIPNNHNHDNLGIDKMVKWENDPNGVRINMGKYGGAGKPVILYLTAAQPAASSSEHRVWIQIDNF